MLLYKPSAFYVFVNLWTWVIVFAALRVSIRISPAGVFEAYGARHVDVRLDAVLGAVRTQCRAFVKKAPVADVEVVPQVGHLDPTELLEARLDSTMSTKQPNVSSGSIKSSRTAANTCPSRAAERRRPPTYPAPRAPVRAEEDAIRHRASDSSLSSYSPEVLNKNCRRRAAVEVRSYRRGSTLLLHQTEIPYLSVLGVLVSRPQVLKKKRFLVRGRVLRTARAQTTTADSLQCLSLRRVSRGDVSEFSGQRAGPSEEPGAIGAITHGVCISSQSVLPL